MPNIITGTECLKFTKLTLVPNWIFSHCVSNWHFGTEMAIYRIGMVPNWDYPEFLKDSIVTSEDFKK